MTSDFRNWKLSYKLGALVALGLIAAVVVALGRIGFDAYLQLLKQDGLVVRPKPAFAHGSVAHLPNGKTLIGCYHPSRQNTNTGRLTASMMDDVFRIARRELRRSAPKPESETLRRRAESKA